MLKVVIRNIGRQNILSDEDYAWVLDHLDKPLTLSSVDLDPVTGEALHIVIRRTAVITATDIIVLFVDSNAVKYEFVGKLPMRNF